MLPLCRVSSKHRKQGRDPGVRLEWEVMMPICQGNQHKLDIDEEEFAQLFDNKTKDEGNSERL